MKQLAILFLALLFFGCSSYDRDLKKIYNKISDIEPNDDIKHANPVVINDPILGFYNKKEKGKNDIDFFKTRMQSRDTSYEISLTAVPGIDSRIKIYDENGRILYTIDENQKGESEKLWEFYPKGDMIYFSVESKSGYNEKVPYVVNFIKKEEAPAEEIEPNNVENDATVIKLGETKKGFISPKNDIDYYKLKFEDDVIHDFSIEIETLSNVDINFIIINKLTDGYKTINNFSWGGSESYPYLSSNKGDYLIKVSGKISDDKKDPLYYITIRELPGVSDDNNGIFYEREFNDTAESSTEIISGNEIIGAFFPEKDSDWYDFELYKKPISVDLSLSRVKGIDPIIEIYDSNKKLLKSVNNVGKDNSAQVSLNNIEAGKYYVRLYSDFSSLLMYKLYFYIRYE
jgi:hypothetical protein